MLSRSAIITGSILIGILFIVLWVAGNFNGLVSKHAGVENAWSKVETQYQRRLDLIDNVVASAKGSQAQEREVIEAIADARKQYSAAETTNDKAAAASSLESTVAILPRLQEAYPELKSNEQVSRLITELYGTENQIAGVRDGYNDTVTRYNVSIASFPSNLFASMFGFERAKLFKADAGASKAPSVNFGGDQGGK